MAQQLPTVFGQMPPFGQVAQLVQPILVNASHQQMAEPFCADGTNNLQFLNGCVSALGQPLPPLCLIVVSIDHRPAQPTPAGPLAVTNCVLRTGDGHRVEASGWQAHAGALAALCVGTAYWFTNCVTRAKYQRLDCWYRIGVGGPNALVVPHVAPESPANIPPMVPVQVGAGRDAVRVPTNVTNAVDERADADLDNNNNDNVGLESRPSPCASRTAGARPTQRRAAEPAHQRFFELVNTETILLGHSLESDLRAMHLIHRRVVDTSVVFPHRMGPPYKRALKTLAAELTQMIIQDDESGHDSKRTRSHACA